MELPYALLTNPYDKRNMKEMLMQAIGMESSEREIRMKRLYEIVSHYDIIRNPVVTEKSTLASERNQVVFDVAIDASKTDIKAAVEGLFSVKVKAVNTLVRKGKVKRFRNSLGVRNDTKKAIVTLVDGQSIDISTGV